MLLAIVCQAFLVVLVVPSASTTAFQHQLALTPHHVLQTKRFKNDDDWQQRHLEWKQVDAAYQGYGTHYVDMWTGTPPQRQTLIIDTGSSGVVFPCSSCTDCGTSSYHVDQLFDETKSVTFEEVGCNDCKVGHCNNDNNNPGSQKCEAGYAYVEGSSWSGFEARDMVYMMGDEEEKDLHNDDDDQAAQEHQFELHFVCQTSMTGFFKTELADGILGMGPMEESYWHQAKTARATSDKEEEVDSSFSLCFARQPTASRNGTEAGAFTMGGTDPKLHNANSPMVYGTYSSPFFSLNLKNIYMRAGGGGDSALSSSTGIKTVELEESKHVPSSKKSLLDSGTTHTHLPVSYVTAFKKQWEEWVGSEYHNQPVFLTDEQLQGLPTVLLQFSGHEESNRPLGEYPLGTLGSAVPNDPTRTQSENYDLVVAIPPTHYMEYDNDAGHYTSRLYFDTETSLGANFMMGHDIHFDVDNQRIGFAESSCGYPELLNNSTPVSGKQEWIETTWIWVLMSTVIIGAGLLVGKRLYEYRRASSTYQVADDKESELHDCAEQTEPSSFTIV